MQYIGRWTLITPVRTFSQHYPFMKKSNTQGAEFKITFKIKKEKRIKYLSEDIY